MLALTPDEALDSTTIAIAGFQSRAHKPKDASPAAELVLAADQFIITPAGRLQDAARAHAAGDEIRTVIAGYHWFTDWGRDTMISLGRADPHHRAFTEAGWILRTFAHYIRNGLIPNMFPEGKNQGLYHTADATLWFFHALHRYVEATVIGRPWPHFAETAAISSNITSRHAISASGVDPADGLLRQGAPGYQLTWMDAKVDDWVVTPRRGKAVEINGLWYNALRLLERWLREEDDEASRQRKCRARRTRKESFNRRFWYAGGKLSVRHGRRREG